jgi:outer membrane protein assembly factor BamB
LKFALALFFALFAAEGRAGEAVKFEDVVGWWSADPSYGGESSRVVLHFLQEDGKQSVRLSLPDIGGFDNPIGTVTLSGDTLDMQPYPFPLRYDAGKGTLSGFLPEAAVPVYRIPIEFRRIGPLTKPEPPSWEYPRPAVKWTFDTKSAVWAGIERDASTGVLYVGNDAGTVHALSADGKQRWQFATGGAIKARPTVIGDSVYVVSDSGRLFRLDKRTGKERWQASVDAGSPERIPIDKEESRWDEYGSSVVSDGESLFVASRDKFLYALDLASGKQHWRIAAKDIMTATPAINGDMVLFAAFDGLVQAVARKDGTLRWTYDAKLPVAGDLTIDGDRVLLGSRTYDLIALDAASGRELWKHYYWFSWIESPAVVRDGVAYTGSSDAIAVFAIDANDGHLHWKTRVPGWAWPRTAVSEKFVVAATVGRGAYPGSRSGSLVAIDRATGKIVWIHLDPPSEEFTRKQARWGFGSGPVVADGVVYAADLQGRVYALIL